MQCNYQCVRCILGRQLLRGSITIGLCMAVFVALSLAPGFGFKIDFKVVVTKH